MDFRSKHDKKFEANLQKSVTNLRICRDKREKLIKELDEKKAQITSIEEWMKIWH